MITRRPTGSGRRGGGERTGRRSGGMRRSINTCPRCGGFASRGGLKVWQIVVAILFFPLGLIVLAIPNNQKICRNCGAKWG